MSDNRYYQCQKIENLAFTVKLYTLKPYGESICCYFAANVTVISYEGEHCLL